MDVAFASWKTHMLFISGKVVLAKYVLNALPNHVIQSIYLPRTVCDQFDKRIRDFIWGDQAGRQRVHAVNWDIVTLSMDRCGLGIRNC